MSNLEKDTENLFKDFFNILERYLIVAWNILMKVLISIKIMPFLIRYPKCLVSLIILMFFITPPISIFWIAIGIVALINEEHMKKNFIIEPSHKPIEHCYSKIKEFHHILSGVILDEKGRSISSLSEESRMGFIVYEIQVALMIAKDFNLNKEHYQEFITIILVRIWEMPRYEAKGMAAAFILNPLSNCEWVEAAINGKEAYRQLTLGVDNLVQHIKDTLVKLEKLSNIKI